MTTSSRLAPAEHHIHPLIRARWSPRSFSGEAVTPGEMQSLLEAARWSSSCFNEQPWNFIVGLKGDETFPRLFACLSQNNQGWAGKAGALLIAVARTKFAANGNPNAMAFYDLGQSMAQMALQAIDLGLVSHQMRGFDVERARVEFGVPVDHEPMAAIAIGRLGSPKDLPEALAAREIAPRVRKKQAEFAFGGDWGSPLRW
jgi:nitroreductase